MLHIVLETPWVSQVIHNLTRSQAYQGDLVIICFVELLGALRYTVCIMLQLRGSILNRPILSLRTGGVVATTTAAIINPNNLKIEGLYCQDTFERKKTLILLSQDIRDVMLQGFIVDDHTSLTEPSELVRLKSIMNMKFDLINKSVITSSKEKVGKVVDYATDLDSMYIKKLYIAPSMFKNLTGGNLSVDRTQIVEINDRVITINDLLQGIPAGVRVPA